MTFLLLLGIFANSQSHTVSQYPIWTWSKLLRPIKSGGVRGAKGLKWLPQHIFPHQKKKKYPESRCRSAVTQELHRLCLQGFCGSHTHTGWTGPKHQSFMFRHQCICPNHLCVCVCVCVKV